MMKRLISLWIVFAILPLCAQSPPKVDSHSQPAVEALRTIARNIKQCPSQKATEWHWGKTEVYRTVVGPPTNVTWDVNAANSVRAPYVAYIEFNTRWTFDVFPPESFSKFARKYPGAIEDSMKESAKRHDWRYEFDLGPEGLELTRVFYRQNEDWQPSTAAYCWGEVATKGQTVATKVNQ